MKNMIRITAFSLILVAASLVYGGVPAISVTVADASGKAAFKGTTDAKGAFATSRLKAGNYVVQFNSGNAKGHAYTIVVAAGTKKVSAAAVPGEKFGRGGVALKVDVGADLNITGQVAEETGPKAKDGKKMVWIPKQLGSNIAGHWAEEGSAEAIAAKNNGTLISNKGIQDMQNRGVSPGN